MVTQLLCILHNNFRWNGQVNPILSYTIKGAIYYQGECNVPFPGNYKSKTG